MRNRVVDCMGGWGVAGLESGIYLSAEQNSAVAGRGIGSGTSNNSVSYGAQAWSGSERAEVKDEDVHRSAPARCRASISRGPPEKGFLSNYLVRVLQFYC